MFLKIKIKNPEKYSYSYPDQVINTKYVERVVKMVDGSARLWFHDGCYLDCSDDFEDITKQL